MLLPEMLQADYDSAHGVQTTFLFHSQVDNGVLRRRGNFRKLFVRPISKGARIGGRCDERPLEEERLTEVGRYAVGARRPDAYTADVPTTPVHPPTCGDLSRGFSISSGNSPMIRSLVVERRGSRPVMSTRGRAQGRTR